MAGTAPRPIQRGFCKQRFHGILFRVADGSLQMRLVTDERVVIILLPKRTPSAKQLIGEIENMKPGDDLYDAKIKVLQEQVLHHVEEEEGELFPEVAASELDLKALGKKMAERKTALLNK